MHPQRAEHGLRDQHRILDWGQQRQPAASGNPRDTSAAARSASRVLPAPPLPVRVSNRVEPSSRLTSRSSPRRPTKLVSSAGKLDRPVWPA